MEPHPEEAEKLWVGTKIKAPEIDQRWDEVDRWEVVYSTRWRHQEPSNIVETVNTIGCIKHLGRDTSNWEHRVVIATDNLASLGALGKGRSSSRRMLGLTRQAAVYVLAYGLKILYRFVPSRRNWADGPSRQKSLGFVDARTGKVIHPGSAP